MTTNLSTHMHAKKSRGAIWGWRLLVTVSALLVLNGTILYFFISDSQMMRILSIMEIGAALLALSVAWEGLRRHTRWAWKTLWSYFALLLVLAIHILLDGDIGVGFYYLTLTGLVLVGQLLARRGLSPAVTSI